MAWLDDRAWCHPKFTDITDRAGWVWAKGLAYASGMQTGGLLTTGQQRLIGADTKTRRELVDARLWDETGDSGTIQIHDWNDYNGKRDARRTRERERLRERRRDAQQNAT